MERKTLSVPQMDQNRYVVYALMTEGATECIRCKNLLELLHLVPSYLKLRRCIDSTSSCCNFLLLCLINTSSRLWFKCLLSSEEKEGALKSFSRFTKRPLCKGLFFDKDAGLRPEHWLENWLSNFIFRVSSEDVVVLPQIFQR